MDTRIPALTALFPDSADAALIISETNRQYFTDFVSSLGYLLVARNGSYLFVDSRYEEAAKRQAKNCSVILFRKLADSLGDVLSQNNIKTVLLEGSAFTLNETAFIENILSKSGASAVKDDTLDKLIQKLRIIKTSSELEKMRKAQQITEDALKSTLRFIKEGVSERDIALELEFRMRKAGAQSVSFDLIVLAGAKTSMPHGVPDSTKIKNGDFLLFDIGATVDGYHSDMTRTYVFGKADSSMKRVYETVLQAQLNALEAVRDGCTCGDVDRAARSYIDQAGFEGLFGHSTGHGVGLEIHEAPSVSPNSSFVLRNGMVVTVEPGIYIPGKFGVRIEDMVVVSSDGCINLVSMPKKLTEL